MAKSKIHDVHRDARGENRHDGEGDGVETARFFVETQTQVFWHGARAGAVVKRHHEDADEDHRRNRADPVKMRSGDSVLRSGSAHADNFLRAEVRGHEREPGNPCGNSTPGKEKVRARFHPRSANRCPSFCMAPSTSRSATSMGDAIVAKIAAYEARSVHERRGLPQAFVLNSEGHDRRFRQRASLAQSFHFLWRSRAIRIRRRHFSRRNRCHLVGYSRFLT